MKGVGRYAWNLAEQMDRLLGNEYEILLLHFEGERVEFSPNFGGILLPIKKMTETRFGLIELKRIVSDHKPVVLIRPSDAIGVDYGVPTLTVCHDLNPLIWAAQASRPWRYCIVDIVKEYFRGHAMRNSELVICNSNFVLDAVAKYFNLDRSRMTVAPCGIDARLIEISDSIDCDHVRRRFSGSKGLAGFLLTFATGDTREGFDILPTFWEKTVEAGYEGALVIAGVKETEKYAKTVKDEFSARSYAERVVWLPFLDQSRISDLAGLYTAADFYLEFSKHEGFGMQLAEAMACGTVCFSTGCGGLDEVGGGLTLPLVGDPAVDGYAVAKAWREGRHTGHREIVSEHARKFTWDTAGLAASNFVRAKNKTKWP